MLHELENLGITHLVDDIHAFALVNHQAGLTQDGQVLGDIGLVNAQRIGQVHDICPAIAEEFEDLEAGGVRQGMSHPGGIVGTGEIKLQCWHRAATVFSIPNKIYGPAGCNGSANCHGDGVTLRQDAAREAENV